MTEEEQLDSERIDLESTFLGFCEFRLGIKDLYDWQIDANIDLEIAVGRNKTAVLAPNGSGKSAKIVATAVLYVLSIYPQARVVITSKDGRQLDGQLWRALLDFKPRFPEWHWTERSIQTPGPSGTFSDGGFAVGFTTDDAGRAEGWHKINELIAEGETGAYTPGPLLMIGDEVKSIPDAILQGIDRCSYTWLKYVSSGGWDQGRFYDACTKADLGFHVIKVGLADCPHIDKEKIADTIRQYGPDDPFTRSTLHGEFMPIDTSGDYVVSRTLYDQAVETPPSYQPGDQAAFVDFGKGTAETVIYYRKGNRVHDPICWKDSNSRSTIYRVAKELKGLGMRASEVYGDNGSSEFIDGLHEIGWPINRVNNGDPARNPDRYEHLGAEMWHEGGKSIEDGRWILPKDPITREQVTTRKNRPLSDGRESIEKKPDMAKRGLVSPDRADALLGLLSIESTLAPVFFDLLGLRMLEAMAQTARYELGALDVAGDMVAYTATAASPWLTVFERPVSGFEYLAVLNPPRRDEAVGDHVFFILRDAYLNEAGEMQPVRLACRLRLPCKLDCGPLAEMVWRIVLWYGRPLIIPIVNDRGDIVSALRKRGLAMNKRQEFEMQRRGAPAKTFEYGWESTEYTKSLWIGELAEAIREERLRVEDIHTVMQLFQLNNDNATTLREAEALGVGLKNITFASRNLPKNKVLENPYDNVPQGVRPARRRGPSTLGIS